MRIAPQIDERTLTSVDATSLPVRHWAADGKPAAILLALHGFNDYSNAFDAVAPGFAAAGIETYAYDQRGFGRSPGTGIWAGQANLTRDLAAAVEAIRRERPGVPITILGESMGGAVAIDLLARRPDLRTDVRSLVLVAPALWGKETMNAFYRSTLWLGAHTIPGVTVTGKGLRILASDNIEMLRALGRDPLIIKQTRIDAIYGLVHLMDDAYDRVDAIGLPTLFLYGAKDQVIPKAAIARALPRLKSPSRIAFYDNGYHLLLRDLQGEIVRRDVAAFVLDPGKPLPSGAEDDWAGRLERAPDPRAALYAPRKAVGRTRWHHRSAITLY